MKAKNVQAAARYAPAIAAIILAGCGGGGGYGGDDPPPAPPAPPAAPTVSLNAPAGASVNRSVALSATVSSPASITRVEFLVDGAVIANVTAPPFSTEWDTSTVPDGDHTVAARATDSANNVVTSTPLTVTVTNRPMLDVSISPAHVFPEPNSTATGAAQLTFDLITGEATGSLTLEGIAAVAAHIHRGYAGQNGPVVVNFVQSAGDPNRWDAESAAQLTAEQVEDLLAGRLYVNVHSAAYPNGEIRGQIQTPDIVTAVARMSGENVAPPVATGAAGFAGATIDQVDNLATVHVQSSGAEDGDAAHVHIAPAGESAAAALFELTQDPPASGLWSAEQQTISAADRQAFADGQWYVDIHTPGFPEGVLRGQLSGAPASPPSPPAPPPPAAPTLTQLQQTIFTPLCAGCHTGGGAVLPASMNLSSVAATHSAVVGVSSTEKPALLRVAPNDPDNSYLVHKLEGGPDIVGERMPQGGAPLDPNLIADVRAWISAGAQNN